MQPFPAFNELVETRYGRMIVNRHDRFVGRSLQTYGEFSQGEIELFQRVLRPGATAIEAGANVGAHTLFLAQAVGPTGTVYAMEPQRVVFQTLCGNLALNSVPNVQAMPVAVGSQPGTIVVPRLNYAVANNFGGVQLGQHQQGDTVPVITIDSLAVTDCALLKIDVEGMEEDVLRGAQQTIDRCQPIIYAESDRKDKRDSLFRFIDSLGYAIYWHCPRMFNPANFKGVTEDLFPRIVSRNVLCISGQSTLRVNGLERVTVS